MWLPVLWSDTFMHWRPGVLADPRVRHFRDAHDDAGRWFLREVTHRDRQGAKIEWDAAFVYPPGARWDTVPAPLLHWGHPVIADRQALERALLPFLGTPPGAGGP